MVENALKSIADQNYDDWELAFLDDGSAKVGKPVVEKILVDHLDKVKFYNTNDTMKDKITNSGSRIGMLMNQAIKESDAEAAFMLCDDDALYPEYLRNLHEWFVNYPNRKYCYSDVVLFNPFTEKPNDASFKTKCITLFYTDFDRYKSPYNRGKDIVPVTGTLGIVDASQPAWRTSCNKEDDIWFPYPKTCNLDISFLGSMHFKYGICFYSGFYGQYKAIHQDALSRKNTTKGRADKLYRIQDI